MRIVRHVAWIAVLAVAACRTDDLARPTDQPPTAAPQATGAIEPGALDRAAIAGIEAPRQARILLTLDDADQAERAALLTQLEAGRARVEAFFGATFPEDIRVTIHPSRAAFTASFPPEWGLTETECWMVAYGVADSLSALSPRVWDTEACEHDGDDPLHVGQILSHELTHVFHGQHNPTRDFTGAEEVGWFAEGLGALVSGQLDHEHRDDARQALAAGQGPVDLASAWSGRWRYGVCGSLARHLDALVGREQLLALLAATSNAEILVAACMDEAGLLESWAAAVGGDG